MTDKQDPIAHAARLLREAAEELRQAHAYSNSEGWENETDAKTAYDEHMAAAQALEDWEAAVGAGGVQAISAAPRTPTVEQVEDEISMGHGAWDMVDPQELIGTVLRLSVAASPPAEQQAAPKAAPGEPPGIQALMCVISSLHSLRDTAHFSDEEGGELMSALCALRDWAHAQPAPAPQQEAQEPYGYVFAEQYAPIVGSELKTTREVFARVKPIP